jgi:hypothetical protein
MKGGEPAVKGGRLRVMGGEPAVRGGEPAVRGGEPAVMGGEPTVRGGEPAVRASSQAWGSTRQPPVAIDCGHGPEPGTASSGARPRTTARGGSADPVARPLP